MTSSPRGARFTRAEGLLSGVLVVAARASGDRAAAAALSHLRGVSTFGLGGPALLRQGMHPLGDSAAEPSSVPQAGSGALATLQAWRAVLKAGRERRPRAALIVNHTEFSARIARRLHAMGTKVLWYGAPAAWAHPGSFLAAIQGGVHAMALTLPFEEALWKTDGFDARYVGHPSLETVTLERDAARTTLGMTPYAPAIAILLGRFPHQVHQLLDPILLAFDRLQRKLASIDARVLLSPDLPPTAREWVMARCRARNVDCCGIDAATGATRVLRAFDVAVCAPGEAALEAALCRAVPVVTHRVGLAAAVRNRWTFRPPGLSLPNMLLGRRVFPELAQEDCQADRIADAVEGALDRRESLVRACGDVEAAFGAARSPSRAVAQWLSTWLGA